MIVAVFSLFIFNFGVQNYFDQQITNAVNNSYDNNASNYDKLILQTLPETITFLDDSLYVRLINICHYIALLSDRQAIIQYKKIKGLSIN